MPVLESSSSETSSLQESEFDKVAKYEHFLNEVLRTDLKTTLERRDELYNEIAQYIDLQTIVEKLSTASEGDDNYKLKTRVDIGCNFYVQAEIPDLKMMNIDIGCGIWLPMTKENALKFCDKKLSFLNARVEELTAKELNIKAQIKLVIEGLREIQKIGLIEPKIRYEY